MHKCASVTKLLCPLCNSPFRMQLALPQNVCLEGVCPGVWVGGPFRIFLVIGTRPKYICGSDLYLHVSNLHPWSNTCIHLSHRQA